MPLGSFPIRALDHLKLRSSRLRFGFEKGRCLYRRIRRRLRFLLLGEDPRYYFDVYDLERIHSLFSSHSAILLRSDPRMAERELLNAAGFILAIVASSPKLRKRFPHALSAGRDGFFARWIANEGAIELGLSARAVEQIIAAFELSLGVVGDRLYEVRPDVRAMFPLAWTPAQRGAYLEWVAKYGSSEHPDISPIAILWSLFEHEESPDHGLVKTYLNQADWQREVPHGLTRIGWTELKVWLQRKYGIRGRWLRTAELEPQFTFSEERSLVQRAKRRNKSCLNHNEALTLGVNVLGLFRYPSGLQQAACGLVESLQTQSVQVKLRDLPVRTSRDRSSRNGFDSLELHPISILNFGLDLSISAAYEMAGLYARPEIYRIAVWWWELDRLPEGWLDRGHEVNEIWAPSAFIAQALEKLGKPVYRMLPGIALPGFERRSKTTFGLDPKRFTFLFIFDMNSRMSRKNPLALIQAFRREFTSDEPVELVIKVGLQEDLYQENWAMLRNTAARAGVRLIDRTMDRGELLALIDVCDCYISLHRSEGFGLTMAEAMLLGKPTIATNYSGNLDFMTTENSYLIDSEIVPVESVEMEAAPGSVWAEPSLTHARSLMRWVFEHPEEARFRGQHAQGDLREKLSPEAAGRRMITRLTQIARSL